MAFFEKDPIQWREHRNGALYATRIRLKKNTTSRGNGRWGALMIHVPNDTGAQVLSFVRQDANGNVFAAFNFSDKAQTVRFQQTLYRGAYTDYVSGKQATYDDDAPMRIEACSYWVIGLSGYRAGLSGVRALIRFTHRDCLDLWTRAPPTSPPSPARRK